MNDNIMYTWSVVSSDVGTVMFQCAKKETAEYLRDWCEAEEYNRFVNARKTLNTLIGNRDFERMSSYLDKYSICESEVILD